MHSILVPQRLEYKLTTTLLGLLFFVDLLFILGHVGVVYFWTNAPKTFLLDAQGICYPELFQYMKYVTGISVLIYLIAVKKTYAYGPILALFLLLFADDVFQWHYIAGYFVAHTLQLGTFVGGMAMHLGLLLYAMITAALFTGASLLYYHRSSSTIQKSLVDIFVLLGALFFFGVIIDLIHALFENRYHIATLLGVVEEGGEMISLSLLVWYLWIKGVPLNEGSM